MYANSAGIRSPEDSRICGAHSLSLSLHVRNMLPGRERERDTCGAVHLHRSAARYTPIQHSNDTCLHSLRVYTYMYAYAAEEGAYIVLCFCVSSAAACVCIHCTLSLCERERERERERAWPLAVTSLRCCTATAILLLHYEGERDAPRYVMLRSSRK